MTVIVGVDGSVGAGAALQFSMYESVHRQSARRAIAVAQPALLLDSFRMVRLPDPEQSGSAEGTVAE